MALKLPKKTILAIPSFIVFINLVMSAVLFIFTFLAETSKEYVLRFFSWEYECLLALILFLFILGIEYFLYLLWTDKIIAGDWYLPD